MILHRLSPKEMLRGPQGIQFFAMRLIRMCHWEEQEEQLAGLTCPLGSAIMQVAMCGPA